MFVPKVGLMFLAADVLLHVFKDFNFYLLLFYIHLVTY